MKLAAAAICRVELRRRPPPQPPQSVLHLDVVSAHIASTTQQICSLSYTALIKEIIDASPKALSVPRVSRIPVSKLDIVQNRRSQGFSFLTFMQGKVMEEGKSLTV